METYEIHPAFQMTEQVHQGIGVFRSVVETFEHSVFKAYTTLAGKVILPYQTHHLSDGPGLLHRHNGQPLLGKRIVQTDGQMAAAFLKVPFEIGQDTDSGNRDSLRTPGKSPI